MNLDSRLVNVLGESGHDTVLGDKLHSGGHFVNESLVTAQVVTEKRLDAEELVGLETTSLGLGLELLDHRVVDEELVASIIDTVDVAEPGGSNETETAEVVLTPDLLGDRRHDELRDLARSTETDTRKLVHDGGVREALHKSVAVLVNVDAGDVGQKRLDFLVHHLLNELAVDGIVDDLVDVLETSELTSVTESRVGTVEQTQLVHFELLDVVDILDDLNTDLLERRAAITELVLDNPLHEGLGNNWPFILNTKVFGECGNVGLFGAGSDTVDHGVGEGTLLGDPVGDFGVGEFGE